MYIMTDKLRQASTNEICSLLLDYITNQLSDTSKELYVIPNDCSDQMETILLSDSLQSWSSEDSSEHHTRRRENLKSLQSYLLMGDLKSSFYVFLSSLMMEAARTSETSVDNYFTRQYFPEDNCELYKMLLNNRRLFSSNQKPVNVK
jgi:hypothetical protein